METLLDGEQRAVLSSWMILVKLEWVKLRSHPGTVGMVSPLLESVLVNGTLLAHA